MKKCLPLLLACLLSTVLSFGEDNDSHPCDVSMLNGDYGFSISGSRPTVTTAGPAIEQILGVAHTHFYGDGTLTQEDNIHGSLGGWETHDRPGTGSYTVNTDCSGTMTIQSEGTPTPPLLTLRIEVVDHGREVRTVVVEPAAVMVTSNGRRK
jgi:hypothetical protein